MCKWTCDVQRFLLEHFDTIHDSPSQIYHSALPLCPSSSWLCKSYGVKLQNEVKAVKGLAIEWGKCSRTVTFDCGLWALSCWKNTAAVGLTSGDIIILSVITGGHVAVLSGHCGEICCVTFSTDGALLVSGGADTAVRLWDVQTGGIVKTFSGHENNVNSVSISPDATTIASGSDDKTICLWDIHKGECQHVIEQQEAAYHVRFHSIKPSNLIFISNGNVREWDINGDQTGTIFEGPYTVFSLDGTNLALCDKDDIRVQHSETGAVVANLHVYDTQCCCFSPDGRLIAAATRDAIYIWDIGNLNPHPVEKFRIQNSLIWAVVFSSPSSLISRDSNRSVKFWQIGTSPMSQTETYTQPTSSPVVEFDHISLQAEYNITITTDKDGSVRYWDISTGLCTTSFQTPANSIAAMDCQLIDGRFIIVWHERPCPCGDFQIWDNESNQVRKIDITRGSCGLRMSGDCSRVLCFYVACFKVYSTQTGEVMGEVHFPQGGLQWPHTIDGYRLWTSSQLATLSWTFNPPVLHGWDLSTPGSSPVPLSNWCPSKLHPRGTILWNTVLFRVQDIETGKVVFQLARGFGKPIDVQWNDNKLVACFGPTDVLILDFSHLFLL